MKIRKGFVSNSSTSSFVLIGAKVKDIDMVKAAIAIDPSIRDELNNAKYPEDTAFDFLYDSDWKYYGEEGYFGIELDCRSSECGDYDAAYICLDELQEYIVEVERVFNILGINKKPMLISGVAST